MEIFSDILTDAVSRSPRPDDGYTYRNQIHISCQIKATSKNVIPAKAGIQKRLTSLDSRLRGSDKLIIIRGSLKNYPYSNTVNATGKIEEGLPGSASPKHGMMSPVGN